MRARLTKVDAVAGILCMVLLAGVVGAIDSAGQERAKRSVCAYQVREQTGGLLSYANDHDGKLPRPGMTGAWLWDFDVQLANELLDRGVRRESLYCPSNLTAQRHMDHYWLFTNQSWDGHRFRTTGYGTAICTYAYIIQSGNRRTIEGSGDKKWLTSIDMADASSRELVVDATLSTTSSSAVSGRTFGRIAGGMYTSFQVFDRSSHLRDDEHPWGGTIGFLDGHADWRPFEEMEGRYGNPRFWW
jgi:hypothetical protein